MIADFQKQKGELQTLIFKLTGGLETVSDGAIMESFTSAKFKIQGAIPKLFGQPNLADERDQSLLTDFSGQWGIDSHLYESYGPNIWISLCEAVMFRHIWHVIKQRFCVGADETLAEVFSVKGSIEGPLLILEGLMSEKQSGSKGKFICRQRHLTQAYLA